MTTNSSKFDLQAELDAIDRRRALLHSDLDRAATRGDRVWLWSLAVIAPIVVGVFLGLVL